MKREEQQEALEALTSFLHFLCEDCQTVMKREHRRGEMLLDLEWFAESRGKKRRY